MAYTYEDIITAFSPEFRGSSALGDLINLFGLVSEAFNNETEGGMPDIQIINGTKGEIKNGAPNFRIEIPTTVGTGRLPVGNNTFILYDRDVALVHEIQHAILRLMYQIGDTELDGSIPEETNISVLSAAYNQAIVNTVSGDSVLDELIDILNTGWNYQRKISIAMNPTASFENRFNLDRNYLVNISGISINNTLSRVGYHTIMPLKIKTT